jgi:hypothetical protein
VELFFLTQVERLSSKSSGQALGIMSVLSRKQHYFLGKGGIFNSSCRIFVLSMEREVVYICAFVKTVVYSIVSFI